MDKCGFPPKNRWVRFAETYIGPELRTAASRAVAVSRRRTCPLLSLQILTPRTIPLSEYDVQRVFGIYSARLSDDIHQNAVFFRRIVTSRSCNFSDVSSHLL